MRICDIPKCGDSAQPRELPDMIGYGLDMCEKHWNEYLEAVKLTTTLFKSLEDFSDDHWLTFRSRLLASRKESPE